MSSEKNIDPRIRRTKRLLQTALLDLLRSKPLDQIHIKDISSRAEISRQAFYLNFETKEEILFSYFDDAFAEVHQKVIASFMDTHSLDLKTLLTESFLAYQENIETVRWVMQVENKDLLISRLRDQIASLIKVYHSTLAIGDQKRAIDPYVLDYVAGGIYMLLQRWSKDGMNKSPEEMGSLAFELMKGYPDIHL